VGKTIEPGLYFRRKWRRIILNEYSGNQKIGDSGNRRLNTKCILTLPSPKERVSSQYKLNAG
jgi:hypothetical protein